MRSVWEKANLNWVWTWMAVYGGSMSMLAAYVASTIAAATAEAVKETKRFPALPRWANEFRRSAAAFSVGLDNCCL